MKDKLTQAQRYAVLKLLEFKAGTYMSAHQIGVSIATMEVLLRRGLVEEKWPRFLLHEDKFSRLFKLTARGRGSE